ncbi:MAG: bifunctional (p)ppGpp synthetase/guanosine-3',5'-bis(diphosphate) 3'-pyrophosphohydrolase [Candidatus Polarisedimenticolaceae bacterium]|nr:bifunctional (p)ppGpp synthetase/guanosine-3',5'-bis(diphosphate) 3'-pyrophosphohydrolase [Candidatus Polarisedimenticolaceae bacterium]
MVSTTTNLPTDSELDQRNVATWLDSITPDQDQQTLRRLKLACDLALRTEGGQLLASGETRVRHALSVADILAGLKLDYETLVAAILNGVLAHHEVSLDDISHDFGKTTARMLDDLQRISLLAGFRQDVEIDDEVKQAENLRRLMLGIAEDVRVVLIVVAERLHVMRNARALPDHIRRPLAKETQEIYAPLANRLGIWQIKWELEDLSLRFLDPDAYKEVVSLLDGRRSEREAYITRVITLLNEKFDEAGINAEITGRPKHIYSIWGKMQRKGVGFEEIFDLRAVRVLVEDVADCYTVLGIVHGLWRHIPGEFDDYIATPKNNMYQSIHTAVIGPDEKTFEVQVRTHDMHHHAELGVAAHWRYKENKHHDADFERRVVWMRHWLEFKEDDSVLDDSVDELKGELESSLIYVLTPKGKVVELPEGATALDFAYAVHTEVGHCCRGARVNGQMVQLTKPLRSGETIEVLTSKSGTPSRDWLSSHLNYLKTRRARNRVRQWFKQQDYEVHLDSGRKGLEREIVRLGISDRPDLVALAERFNFKSADDLLAAIGRGDISSLKIAAAGGGVKQAVPKRRVPPADVRPISGKGEVIVQGVSDLMTHVAGCCKPVPYDPIIGFITRGRGVTVHRRDCSNVSGSVLAEPERLVDVTWGAHASDSSYAVDVRVLANDRRGLLSEISALYTAERVDVMGVNTASNPLKETASMMFTIQVIDITQLSRILNKIAQIPDVTEVKRQI